MTVLSARRGFTLSELLVVVTILGLLAALLLPVLASVREKSRRSVCLSNQHQLGTAIFLYAADNDESFPSESGTLSRIGDEWVSQCFPYFKSVDLLRCPDDNTQSYNYGPGLPTYYPDSYGINGNVMGWATRKKASVAANELASPAHTTLLFEVGNDITATVVQKPPAINGSATGTGGGDDCGGSTPDSPATYPCGISSGDGDNPVPLYMTGNIGGRTLNGGAGSTPRHKGGSNYVACDGHAVWLRPEAVSGGRSQTVSGVNCGQDDAAPGCGGSGAAAGTGDGKYMLTFSVR